MKKYQEGELVFVLAKIEGRTDVCVLIICMIEEVWWSFGDGKHYLIQVLHPEKYNIEIRDNHFCINSLNIYSLKNFAAQQFFKDSGIEFGEKKANYFPRTAFYPTINLTIKSLNYAKNQEMNEKLKHPRKRKILTSCKELLIKKDQ